MKRFILTGTPGSGKTTLLRLLERQGCAVVEESATDVIALEQALGDPEPWLKPGFIDAITDLQRRRSLNAASAPIQVYDRSPVCTYALAVWLGHAPSPLLLKELDRITRGQVYQRRVLFLENLGHVAPTPARRITFEDALRFEQVHLEAYRRFGYELVSIPAGPLLERLDAALSAIDPGAFGPQA